MTTLAELLVAHSGLTTLRVERWVARGLLRPSADGAGWIFEPVDVARVDAGEERFGEVVGRLASESPPHERRDRFILPVANGRNERLARHAQLAHRREERRAGERPEADRKAHERALHQWREASALQDVRREIGRAHV